MSWIENIKDRLGRFSLNRSKKRPRSTQGIPTFDQVHDIGIIYHAGIPGCEEQINQVAHFLREQGKKVWMMGYVNAKTLPHTKKFHISSEYFWKEKLTWNNLPDTSKIGNFISHPFDLLLNLYFENELPLQALSTYCEAKYTMGAPLSGGLSYNDALIDTGTNHNIKNLASQMVHYLKVINQKQ